MSTKRKSHLTILTLFLMQTPISLSQKTQAMFLADTVPFKEAISELISKEEYMDENNSLFFTVTDILHPETEHHASILELTEMILGEKQYVPSVCNCYLKNDTLIVTGSLGYNDYIYFQISAAQDKHYGILGLVDMTRLLTSGSHDMKNVRDLEVPLDNAEMQITSKPALHKVIYGEGSAKSTSFYELVDETWVERQMQIRFIFKCTVNDHGPY